MLDIGLARSHVKNFTLGKSPSDDNQGFGSGSSGSGPFSVEAEAEAEAEARKFYRFLFHIGYLT